MDEQKILQEIDYKAVRSSGAGGQNVNKVATKVELHFNLPASEAFSEEEKQRLLNKLGSKLTNAEELVLQCEESRSQHKNKEIVTQRLLEQLKQALIKPKPRKKTKVPKRAKMKRLKKKKMNSEKKAARKDPLKE
ncbi:MAG: alternative ribosome rescue aminoacyl-tRNA hydrolase ArfB [Salinimicrobium sp.]